MLDPHIDTVATRPLPSISGLRVLVAEDEAMVAEHLTDLLADMGHRQREPVADRSPPEPLAPTGQAAGQPYGSTSRSI